jgi:putative two-component system response regulator
MTLGKASILVVDGEPAIRKQVTKRLSDDGYFCLEAGNTKQALETLYIENISLVILSANTPDKPGIELLPEIITFYPEVAVIMATDGDDKNTAIQSLKQGAYDYITKPFNVEEVSITIQRAFENRKLIIENTTFRRALESDFDKQARVTQSQSFTAISALVNALEAKNDFTRGHSQKVSEIAVTIAKEMGLYQEDIDKVQFASLVHDVGNIGVKDFIFNKPSSLNQDETNQARKHTEIGEKILKSIAEDEEIVQMVRGHHERFDGSGYPDGLKGRNIPLGARIIAIADAYEAMTSERPYRQALSTKEALKELERCKKTQFDPDIVDTFLVSRWWQRLRT